MKSAKDTALLLEAALEASELKRARISEATLQKISKRERLSVLFQKDLIQQMDIETGWNLIELDSGGFGVIKRKSLEAAKFFTLD